MSESRLQTAIIQTNNPTDTETLPLVISHSVPIPTIPSEHHVLVRVLAVALNPTDWKNPTYFPSPGQGVGSDFCGIVKERGSRVTQIALGTRVCGAVFPYGNGNGGTGAFAEWVVADARLLIKVPSHWDDLKAAALGGIGWGTVAVALSDPDALALDAFPSRPAQARIPILVYGGATATGTMACQILSLSGYTPVAITSTQSASLAISYGAAGASIYTSNSCVETARDIAKVPIRHVLDCITSPDSAATCFAAMARTGGRYACLEALDEAWRTRRLIRVKEVMGYEGLGLDARIGPEKSTYTREANTSLFAACQRWAVEVQRLVDEGLLKNHPAREISVGFEGVIHGLHVLRSGEVRGEKLVVRIST